MNLLKHCKDFRLMHLHLLALSFACVLADFELTAEYLSDLKADEALEIAAGEYNYDNQGNDWTGTCASGQKQSPIDLIYDDADVVSIPRIRFQNYNQQLQTPLVLVNNGHTANMVLPPTRRGERPSISGGLLPGVFEAQSVHFHWGSANSKGSEHAINFERYDVEMHIVHKNTRYADLSVGEASAFSDGLAVLGVMFRARPRPISQHYGLNKVFNALPRIITYQSNTTITGMFNVGQLLGNIVTGEFYTYQGSLTTPDCAESVTWTVFKDVLDYPNAQIAKLWNLQDSRSRPLINTYRELQDINNRTISFRQL
ncbi:carbonic anhydrase 2-like [Drosophila sulfurigaster albostrigata]|uniref:carbonic anhydrase 2-like n=1 Tax=Drosophila sulfurigaster albostrigata TaxID=89887 RepID=UPI002D21DB61|nr:carbonic anhydrase 2-like [Drosophila sulfurigaster albostrigata]